MINIETDIGRDHGLMQILQVNELKYLIANTDHGELFMTLSKGEDNYRFVLDGTPVADELNYQLIKFFQ